MLGVDIMTRLVDSVVTRDEPEENPPSGVFKGGCWRTCNGAPAMKSAKICILSMPHTEDNVFSWHSRYRVDESVFRKGGTEIDRHEYATVKERRTTARLVSDDNKDDAGQLSYNFDLGKAYRGPKSFRYPFPFQVFSSCN